MRPSDSLACQWACRSPPVWFATPQLPSGSVSGAMAGYSSRFFELGLHPGHLGKIRAASTSTVRLTRLLRQEP
jgi:hypothetical protein